MGQICLTKFKDYKDSIKVTLNSPESEESMMNRIYSFAKATWADSPEELLNATPEQKRDALDQMLSGKALGLALETVNLSFMIAGISHIDAQQITRQRIGVTFSAQCTGDRFLNHNEVLVEESIAAKPIQYDLFVESTLSAKNTYASLNDNGISIQASRSILPRNMETFYNMHTNLMTLLFFHQKRIDDGSQTWQMNVVAQQMADEVCKAYPQLVEVFEKNKKKFKFQKEAGADRKNTFSTGLYIPKDDEFDYHNQDFLYPVKKEEMHFTGSPLKENPDYYWGWSKITKDQYDLIKSTYEKFDKEASENHYTNEEILEKISKINSQITESTGIVPTRG